MQDLSGDEQRPVATSGPLPGSHALAWKLAEELSHWLDGAAMHPVYVQLGCRHYRRAVAEALRAAVRAGVSIPHTLADELNRWLLAYSEHDDHADLTRLLDRARLHTSNAPVPKRHSC